jgi:hypothetical protein
MIRVNPILPRQSSYISKAGLEFAVRDGTSAEPVEVFRVIELPNDVKIYILKLMLVSPKVIINPY